MADIRTQCAAQKLEAAALPVLDMLPMGLLLIGYSGNVLAANRVGRQTLDRGGSIRESGGVLRLSPPIYERKLQSFLTQARAGDGSVAVLRLSRRPAKPLLILFVPLLQELAREPESGPLALLIMNGPPHQPDRRLLTDFFEFTEAEARVASLLMQGKPVADVAQALRISANTTRNHLKRMYWKTRTRKQVELLHILLSSPASLALANVTAAWPSRRLL